MHVTIKDMPAYRLAAIRHIGPYVQIGDAFARLGAIAGPAGLFGPGAIMLGIYYDDPDTTPAAELRADAGLTIAEGITIPSGLAEAHLPAGPYAMTTHIGSYEGLSVVWAQLKHEWLPASGRTMPGGASYEIYRNTPMDVPKEQLVTELYMPLAR